MRNGLRKLSRSRLLHFLVLGMLLWLGRHGFAGARTDELVLDGARIGELEQKWQRALGRPLGDGELQTLIGEAIDEEILFREALRHGLDRLPTVRRRLLQLGRYLELGDPRDGSEAVEARAVALGLDRTDAIVRRYLVASMREKLRAGLAEARPSEEEVAAHLREHADQYALPLRVRLSHVFVGGHTGASLERIRRLRREILETGLPPDSAAEWGDPFYGGQHLPLWSRARLAAALGDALAAAASRQPVASWSQPVASPYGQHLLWVHEVEEARSPEPSAVRDQIARRLIEERREGQLRELLRAMRERYRIRVDSVAGVGVTAGVTEDT